MASPYSRLCFVGKKKSGKQLREFFKRLVERNEELLNVDN